MSLREFGVALAIVAGLIALLLPVVEEARDERGPAGNRAPTDLPRESQRYHQHETGLSIILPENWEFRTSDAYLRIYARKKHGRLTGQIYLRAVHPPSDVQLSACTTTRHGELPAFETMAITNHNTGDDPGYSCYSRLVQTEVGWFQIDYMIQDETTTLPEGVRRFLDTVRFPRTPVQKDYISGVDLPVTPVR